MITQQTAADIWQCYREIEAGKKLLQDMEERKKAYPLDKYAQHLKDAFGRGQSLQLGIPCGENGHRLLDVAPRLALSVIQAHIAEKKKELVDANERARIEVYGLTKPDSIKISISEPVNSDNFTEGSG